MANGNGALAEGQDLAGMADDVDVRVVVASVIRWRVGLVMTVPVAGSHPVISIPESVASGQRDAVEHGRAAPPGEHPLTREVAFKGIGAVTSQQAVQFLWDLSFDLEIGGHDLF